MSIRRRLVMFVGGFDPRGARHYHQLFRDECKRQAALSRHVVEVGTRVRTNHGPVRWSLHRASQPTQSDSMSAVQPAIETCVEFFDWTDVVRQHWPRTQGAVWVQALATYWCVLKHTLPWLPPIRRAAPYTLLTLLYPLLYALMFIVLGLLVGAGSWALAYQGLGTVWGSMGAAIASALAVWILGWWADRHLHASWLLRIFNFAAQREAGANTVLSQRLERTAHRLTAELRQGQWDEVLVVGFSVGSVLGVQLVDAFARQAHHEPDLMGRISLVTLGNCLPLFALMPQSHDVRAALGRLSHHSGLYWADISSPSDSVSFALCDVVGLSLREDAAQWRTQPACNPRAMCSPRFHQLFRPRSYALIRRNKMRMHMQYLMCGELPGAYDYFEMVAGWRSLRQYLEDQLIR